MKFWQTFKLRLIERLLRNDPDAKRAVGYWAIGEQPAVYIQGNTLAEWTSELNYDGPVIIVFKHNGEMTVQPYDGDSWPLGDNKSIVYRLGPDGNNPVQFIPQADTTPEQPPPHLRVVHSSQ